MSSTPSRWKQVPFAASVLVVCGLFVCGAIYLVNYRERDAYLTSRNFRLLAVLAQQTESAIDAHFHTRNGRPRQPDSDRRLSRWVPDARRSSCVSRRARRTPSRWPRS